MIHSKRLIRALKKAGYNIIRQRGSHVEMLHLKSGLRTSVPQHSGNLKKSLYRAILKQVRMTEEELKKYL